MNIQDLLVNSQAQPDPPALRRFLETRARALGFDALAVTRPDAVPALHASIQLLPDGVEPLTVDLSELPEGGAHEAHAH